MSKKILFGFALLILAAALARAQGPAYPYSTAVGWKDSTTPPAQVAGYNVLRAVLSGSSCGSFTQLNSTILSNSTTSFTDSTVSPQNDGLNLCYQVQAVGTNGVTAGTVLDPVPVPPAPPTGVTAVVAKNSSGTYDVIYAWRNPTGPIIGNAIYCNGLPELKTFFLTTKVRVTTPASSAVCGVTASVQQLESGLSKPVKVTVP